VAGVEDGDDSIAVRVAGIVGPARRSIPGGGDESDVVAIHVSIAVDVASQRLRRIAGIAYPVPVAIGLIGIHNGKTVVN
jgi:hypothetical protein